MGEIADAMLDSAAVFGWYRSKPLRRPPVCRYCGKKGLTWVTTDHGWRLFEGGTIHTCESYTRKDGKK